MSYPKRVLLLSISDAVIVSLAVLLSYFLRFDFQVVDPYRSSIPYTIVEHVLLFIIGLYMAQMYRPIFRFASNVELVNLIKVATFVEMFIYALNVIIHYLTPQFYVPRSIYLMTWAFVILGTGGTRFAWKLFAHDSLRNRLKNNRTLIVGAGSAGFLIAREMTQSPNSDRLPVAFIDDDPSKQKLRIGGLPVVGVRTDIPRVVEMYRVDDIIIAMPSAPKAAVKEIFDICRTTKANVKILPYVSDILSSKVSMEMIREVKIEDLLGRAPVQINLAEVNQYIQKETVLVTGAGGSIGNELCRQIASFSPKKLLLLGHGENSIFEIGMELEGRYPSLRFESIIADIQDRLRIEEVFSIHRPSVVFHAAAHKHVPLMEANPVEAIKNNVLGTKNVAECADKYGVSRFVLVSTDKAVNPTSVMGATKRIAEMLVQRLDRVSGTKFAAVRFGNVLGSRGSVIPIFLQQIEKGGPVTITHPDMVRFFMTIPEAAQLVIQAGALAEGGEVFVLDMGTPVRILDMAQDLIRLCGYEPNKDIEVVYTGVRPGEKLYEEILTSEEGTQATKHDRIFIGRRPNYSWDLFQSRLAELELLVGRSYRQNVRREVMELLYAMVPGFLPQHDHIGARHHPNPVEQMQVMPSSLKIEQAILDIPVSSGS